MKLGILRTFLAELAAIGSKNYAQSWVVTLDMSP